MTIKELKEKIKDLPDSMEAFINQEYDEYQYSLLNTAQVRTINFSDGIVSAPAEVLVLEDL